MNTAKNSSELVPLSRLNVGATGTIHHYEKNGDLYCRLRELGLVRGTRVTVKRLAPLRDPMELTLRGYSLSVRKTDAAHIMMIPENNTGDR